MKTISTSGAFFACKTVKTNMILEINIPLAEVYVFWGRVWGRKYRYKKIPPEAGF